MLLYFLITSNKKENYLLKKKITKQFDELTDQQSQKTLTLNERRMKASFIKKISNIVENIAGTERTFKLFLSFIF